MEPDEDEFIAYERARGDVGVRNRIVVLPTVICSHAVADRIADTVDGAVSTPHDHGCGQLGDDSDRTGRTLVNVAANPNVGGALAVGLGCETLQSDGIAGRIADRGVPVEELAIQSAGGTDACYEAGVERATALRDRADAARTAVGLEGTTVGVVSSDCRPATLAKAEPLVGDVLERIVDAGGRVLIAGNERLDAHADAIREQLETNRARRGFEELTEHVYDSPKAATVTRRRAAQADYEEVNRLWEGLPIRDVIAYGERATHETGVAFVDAPSAFDEAATALAAAGAQVVLHVTADGIPTGHPIVPVLTVTGKRDTYEALSDDLDVYAGTTATDDLSKALRNVLDGNPTCPERHGVTTFAITRIGPSI